MWPWEDMISEAAVDIPMTTEEGWFNNKVHTKEIESWVKSLIDPGSGNRIEPLTLPKSVFLLSFPNIEVGKEPFP